MIGDVPRFFIRVSAFLRREIFETLRQPRLLLTLVFGPFLILLLFGLGYRVEPESLRTLFVVNEDSPFAEQLRQNAEEIHPLLQVAGTTDSLTEAKIQLRQGHVDLVAALPDDPVAQIRNNQRATFTVFHNEIDPYQVDFVEAFARIYVDEVNQRVLSEVTAQGQQQTNTVEDAVSQTREAARNTRQALEDGERIQALLARNELADSIGLLSLTLEASTGLVQNLEQRFGADAQAAAAVEKRLGEMREQVQALSELAAAAEGQDFDEELQRVRQIEEEATSLESSLEEFQTIEPNVLVSPFEAEVQSIAQAHFQVSDYYVPSVIALLAQHLAVTFAALSIVRERREGTIELFQVSPLTAVEALLGKYLSYFLLEGLLLTVLTVLSLWALRVPMMGSWAIYVAVTAALVFTSLGLGFVISLLAHNTSQAVQFSMIILLGSIFFSGLFLALELLRPAVRVVSWLLPATYGTQMLQDVMLRGIFPAEDGRLLIILFAAGLGLFVLSWYLLRRRMKQE